jgi:hypothetical protein
MASPFIPDVAERLFTRVFHNLAQRHADVTTFRKLAALGQQSAAATLNRENYGFALSLLNDPQYDEFFKDRKAAVAFFGGPEKMGSDMTSKQLHLYNAAVDAASIVFVHSAVDAAVSDLCRVTYLIDPIRWRPFIENQKVALSEVASRSSDDLWSEKLDAHLAALDKESIRKRAERLFAICKPSKPFEAIANFTYDVNVVERLDKLRQDIIHGSGPNSIPNCVAELDYLVKVGLYFFGMVNRAFDVRINTLYAIGLELPVSGSAART